MITTSNEICCCCAICQQAQYTPTQFDFKESISIVLLFYNRILAGLHRLNLQLYEAGSEQQMVWGAGGISTSMTRHSTAGAETLKSRSIKITLGLVSYFLTYSSKRTHFVHRHRHPQCAKYTSCFKDSLDTKVKPFGKSLATPNCVCMWAGLAWRYKQAGKQVLGSNPLLFSFLFNSCGLGTPSCDFAHSNFLLPFHRFHCRTVTICPLVGRRHHCLKDVSCFDFLIYFLR